MTDFAIYNDLGEILRTGSAPDEMLEIQAQEGEFLFVGAVSQQDSYIDTQTGELVLFPARPSAEHYYDFAAKTWLLQAKGLAEVEREVRVIRNQLISASDWTQLPDVPAATQQKWAAYRQALRDITAQPGFPTDIVWPTPPII